MSDKVKAIPTGMHTVTPYMVLSDATKAIEFYKAAFGAEQIMVLHMPDGKKVMHAEIKIGDSVIMMGEECSERGCVSPETAGKVTGSLMLYCEDVDAAFAKALKAGCAVKMPLMNMFWGDRYGQLSDPFGHMWSLAQHVEDVAEADMPKRAAEAFKQMAAAGK
ncbi:MAG: VOC family protein [Candidatus Melainabacteria bacterium]|nr:VOC family protein [Candidatus Melainabacteria bacterium]